MSDVINFILFSTRQTIPIAKLPRSMDGMTIALLSDIHLGSTVGFTMTEAAVKITNSLKPGKIIDYIRLLHVFAYFVPILF